MYLGTISKEVESYFVFRSVNLLLIADSLSHPFFRYLLYSSVVITSPKYSAIIVFFIRLAYAITPFPFSLIFQIFIGGYLHYFYNYRNFIKAFMSDFKANSGIYFPTDFDESLKVSSAIEFS